MKITITIQVKVEENDGDANGFALTKVANTGDNPRLLYAECRDLMQPLTVEILKRVSQTYPTEAMR